MEKSEKYRTYLKTNFGYRMLNLVISETGNFIYFRQPKVLGTTLQKGILNNQFDDISLTRYNMGILNKLNKPFTDYFRWGFVRNPWDRMVSSYNFFRYNYKRVELNCTFEEYVLDKKYQKSGIIDNHNQPQYKSMYCDGELMLNFVGKMENVDNDWEYVSNKIFGKVIPLMKTNQSTRKSDYRSYYTEKTKQHIEQHFKEDIKLFNYEF